MRKLVASFLLLLASTTGISQTGNFTFTNYNTSQGLPDNNIQSIMQDSRGFLWIGTTEGLSRFDGKIFKNFFSSKGDTIVKANDFNTISEYKKGHLVMNNFDRVICFNTYTEKFYLPDFPPSSYISISKSPGQPGYFLTGRNKAYLLTDDLTLSDSIDALPQKNSSFFLIPYFLKGKESLLVQYNRSFYLYNTSTKKYTQLPITIKGGGQNYLPYFRFYDTTRQELYFSDYLLGLFRYSLITGKTEPLIQTANGIPYANGFIYEITANKKNELRFLTEGGISFLNTLTNTSISITSIPGKTNSLISNSCYSSCTDKDNNWWIATGNGISKLNASSQVIRNWSDEFATSLRGGLMSAVKGPDENMYASVYFGKAYQLNTKTGKVTAWKHPLNYYAWNLFVRGDEVIRTGSGNKLLSYNTKTGKCKELDFLQPYYPNIELIVIGFAHSNGDEWYSANRGGGFVRKLAGTAIYKTYKHNDGVNTFSNSYYTCYTEDNNGDLWFGVNKTALLLHWNIRTEKFSEIDFSSLPGIKKTTLPGINAVTHDAENNIWVASNGGGLVKYSPKENKASNYTISDGLPTNFISGLAFDNNNRLWLNTFKGLSCFIVNEKKFINFKKEDGLPDDYFSDYCIYFDKEKNELWAGANSTLMAFTPDDLLKLNKENFPVYTDEIYINSRKYSDTLQNNFSLRPGENNLQFHFTGVDLSKGKDIEYSYKLEGADKDWVYTATNQSASYTNLKPGAYFFNIRAKHRGDNKWNEMTIPLQFTIATPWQKTWWFKLIVIAAIALLVWYLITSYYTRKLEKQKAVLEKQKAVEQERTRISTDMHDDFGASLSRIKFLSEKLQLYSPGNPSEKNDLEKISLYSDEMAEKMNEIVWALNQRYDSLGDLVSFCRSYSSEYLQDKNIKLRFSSGELSEKKIQGEVRRNIFLVIKEALHNIVKHAHATEVDISFSHDKNLTVIIHDNGKGIDTANIRPFANGLENMKKRMADINGSFSIENKAGTQISISVPV